MRVGIVILTICIGLGSLFGVMWVMDRISASASAKPTAKAPEPPPIPKEGPFPKVVVESTEFDFGSMILGNTGDHVFVIRNDGEGTLELKKGTSTCKCTISDLPEGEVRKVAPGEQAEVKLTWTPNGRTSEFRQMAQVQTNDPNKQVIEFQVKGEVTVLFDVIPPAPWSVPDIPEDQSVIQQGVFVSSILGEFEIESVESSKPSVTHEIKPLSKEELAMFNAKSGYRVKVTLSPDKGIGAFSESVTINANSKNGESQSRVINLVGQRLGPIRITGPGWDDQSMALSMGSFVASKGKKVTLQVFVRGEMAQDFQVVSKTVEPETLKVDLTKDDKFRSQGNIQHLWLSIEVPPGAKTSRVGDKSATIKFQTNHPKVPELNLRVHYLAD